MVQQRNKVHASGLFRRDNGTGHVNGGDTGPVPGPTPLLPPPLGGGVIDIIEGIAVLHVLPPPGGRESDVTRDATGIHLAHPRHGGQGIERGGVPAVRLPLFDEGHERTEVTSVVRALALPQERGRVVGYRVVRLRLRRFRIPRVLVGPICL